MERCLRDRHSLGDLVPHRREGHVEVLAETTPKRWVARNGRRAVATEVLVVFRVSVKTVTELTLVAPVALVAGEILLERNQIPLLEAPQSARTFTNLVNPPNVFVSKNFVDHKFRQKLRKS